MSIFPDSKPTTSIYLSYLNLSAKQTAVTAN